MFFFFVDRTSYFVHDLARAASPRCSLRAPPAVAKEPRNGRVVAWMLAFDCTRARRVRCGAMRRAAARSLRVLLRSSATRRPRQQREAEAEAAAAEADAKL